MKSTLNKLLIINLLYIISNVLLFFVFDIFWDDWALLNTPEGIMQQFIGNGGVIVGYIHTFLMSQNNPFLLYHIIIFGCGLISANLFYLIIGRFCTAELSFVSSCLFASFPLGLSHMTFICIPYQIGLLFQMVSLFLFVQTIYNKGHVKFILSILCFISQYLASMFLISTAVLWFGILCMFALYMTYNKFCFSWSYLRIYILKLCSYMIYFIPCIINEILKTIFFKPTGLYAAGSYNKISFGTIAKYPISLIGSLENAAETLFNTLSYSTSSILLSLLLIVIAIFCFFLLSRNFTENNKQDNTLIVVGVSAFIYICGITAYLLVGKSPVVNSVDDRHGILLPLAMCPFIGVLICNMINNIITKKIVFSIIIALFVTSSIFYYSEGLQLSYRNESIIEYFKNTQLPKGNIIVITKDDIKVDRFYSWSGLYSFATGKEDRCFAVNESKFHDKPLYLREVYHQKNAKPGPPTITIFVNDNIQCNPLLTLFYKYVNNEKYNNIVSQSYTFNLYYMAEVQEHDK